MAKSFVPYIRIRLTSLFGLFVGIVFLAMMAPVVMALFLPPVPVSCQAAMMTPSIADRLRAVGLEDCSVREAISVHEQAGVDKPIIRLENGALHDGPALYLRLPEGHGIIPGGHFDIVAYSGDPDASDIAEALRVELRLPHTPIVLTDTRLIDGASLFATAVLTFIGLICVVVPIFSTISRARMARTRAALEEGVADGHGGPDATPRVLNISLSQIARISRWGRIARYVLMFEFGVMVIVGSITALFEFSAVTALVMFLVLTLFYAAIAVANTGRRSGQWVFLALVGALGLLVLRDAGFDIANVTAIAIRDWALFSAIPLVNWALFSWRGNCMIHGTGMRMFDMEDRFREKISLKGLPLWRRLFLPGRHSIRGLVRMAFVGFAVLIGMVASVAGFGWLWILLLLWAIPAYKKARQQMVPDAREVLAHDPRAPVLFLRAFMNDVAEVETLAGGSTRFEEQITAAAAAVGPPVAIGDPKEDMPKLGAFRTYCDDDSWQAQVESWMDEAKLVLMMAGVTEMLGWEVRKTTERGHLHKLMIVMAPDAPEDRLDVWEEFRRHFDGTPYEAASKEVEPRIMLGCAFAADGTLVSLNSSEFTRLEYELFIRLLIAMGYSEKDWIPPRAF